MTETNRYSTLKQISVLMALDAAGLLIGDAVFLLNGIAQFEAIANNRYIPWAISTARLLVCALTLAALSRLSTLRKSFGKARKWYLLNFLPHIVRAIGISVLNYWYPVKDSFSRSVALSIAKTLMIILFVGYAGEFSLSCGNRAVLFSGAELLETFGLDDPAGKNRRCGNRLSLCSAAQFLFLILGLALVAWVLFVKKVTLFSGDEAAGLTLLAAVMFLFFFLAELFVIAFRTLAAERMSRTYRAIKELTE